MESITSTLGLFALAGRDDVLHLGLGQQAQPRAIQPEPVTAQAHLLGRLLAGDIQRLVGGQHGQHLQQQVDLPIPGRRRSVPPNP
jgi:hypothetical protein